MPTQTNRLGGAACRGSSPPPPPLSSSRKAPPRRAARRAPSTNGNTDGNAVARAAVLRPPRPGRRRDDHRRALAVAPVQLGETGLELRRRSSLHRREPVARGPSPSHAGSRGRRRTGQSGRCSSTLGDGLVDVPHRDRHEVVARERHVAGQQLVEHDARASRCPSSDRPSARAPARARCSRSSRARSRLRDAVHVERAGDPEVGHLRLPVVVQQDVLRLDVAVHEAAVVREGQRVRDLERELDRLANASSGPRADSSFRFSPSTYSKTMNWRPSCSPRSMTVTMFGCGELRDRARLAAEALDVVLVPGVLLVQDLQRDGPLEQPIVRAIDVRHAARADELLELVAARDQLTDHGCSFAEKRRTRRRERRRALLPRPRAPRRAPRR